MNVKVDRKDTRGQNVIEKREAYDSEDEGVATQIPAVVTEGLVHKVAESPQVLYVTKTSHTYEVC